MKTKVCGKCKEEKPEIAFSISKGKLRSVCRGCDAEMAKTRKHNIKVNSMKIKTRGLKSRYHYHDYTLNE